MLLFKTHHQYKIARILLSSRHDTDSMLTSLLAWASGESKTKGKGGLEQPYDMKVRDNWILIGVREQPYVIQVCSDR
jgi:hypothetical protein